jgi:hypothetical protein
MIAGATFAPRVNLIAGTPHVAHVDGDSDDAVADRLLAAPAQQCGHEQRMALSRGVLFVCELTSSLSPQVVSEARHFVERSVTGCCGRVTR